MSQKELEGTKMNQRNQKEPSKTTKNRYSLSYRRCWHKNIKNETKLYTTEETHDVTLSAIVG